MFVWSKAVTSCLVAAFCKYVSSLRGTGGAMLSEASFLLEKHKITGIIIPAYAEEQARMVSACGYKYTGTISLQF